MVENKTNSTSDDIEDAPYIDEKDAKKLTEAIVENQNALPYVCLSKLRKMNAMTPVALFGDIVYWQHQFKQEIPDIDEYVREKLGYNFISSLSAALYGEQVDAVGYAIYQAEKNNALILGDMAGIGKGRVVASVLRYAYRHGKTPIFVTEKTNLFSDFYRDLKNIGGFGLRADGTMIMPYPLILNGADSSGANDIIDLDSKHHVGEDREEDDENNEDEIPESAKKKRSRPKNVIVYAQDEETIQKIVKANNPTLPSKYNCLFLTYSQISGKSKNALERKEFIKTLAKGAVLCFDEAHNVAGTGSDIGLYFQELMPTSGGVLFSSATFAKKASNLNVYAPKTDIKYSSLQPSELLSVITKSGEQMSEYLSSSLARSGQMLRRERSFANCSLEYRYMDSSSKADLYTKYDKAVEQFNKLVAYTTDVPFLQAKQRAVERYCLKNDIPLITTIEPAKTKKTQEQWEEWAEENDGRYYVKYFRAGDIVANKFNFIEMLLFGLKVDFVINLVKNEILNLNKDGSIGIEYTTIEGEKKKGSHKPIIAVRSTLESIYDKLGLRVGDEIDNDDFSLFLVGFALSIKKSNLTLAQFNKEEVPDKKDKKESKKKSKAAKNTIFVEDFEMIDADFADGGKALRDLVEDMRGVELNISLSPIDRLLTAVNELKRPLWDREYIDPKRTNFRAVELTSRKYMLRKNEKTGKYKILENDRVRNKAEAFTLFNEGEADVLIINQSGATGASAHSSSEFKDQRPRTTVIHQVELDVNIEVQKRGRTLRTGMVNYPRYLYAVTQIPSEIRRLLMLMIKLRSLDANTTGNQMQNRKLAQLEDANGKVIEDFINKYGYESLKKFISDNDDYAKYMPSQDIIERYTLSDSVENIINYFLRNLETTKADIQETFYNTFNTLYSNDIAKLKADKMYDLETEIHDLKASLRNRVVCSLNNNKSVFSESVWEEDDYVLQENVPLTSVKVEVETTKLCNGNTDFKQYHQKFLEERAQYWQTVTLPKRLARFSNRADSATEETTAEQKAAWQKEYEDRIAWETLYETNKFEEESYIYKFLYPSMHVLLPDSVDTIETIMSSRGIVYLSDSVEAKFMGFNIIDKKAPNLYAASNVEFVFARLSGKAVEKESPVRIKNKQGGYDENPFFEALLYFTKTILPNDEQKRKRITNWIINENAREFARILNGNILDAYTRAKEQIKKLDEDEKPLYKKKTEFLKYTTVDGDIKFGIRLYFKGKFIELNKENVTVAMPINNPEVINFLTKSDVYSRHINRATTLMFIIIRKGVIRFSIFGGTLRGKTDKEPDAETSKSKMPKYYTRLYHSLKMDELAQQYGKSFSQSIDDIKNAKKVTKVQSKTLVIDTSIELEVEMFKKMLDYIYEYSSDWIDVAPKGNTDVFGISETFDPDKHKRTSTEVKRDYTYNIAPNFNLDVVSTLTKFKSYNRGSGVVTTNDKLSFNEMFSYGLYPMQHTVTQMIVDIFSSLTPLEKIKFDADIKEMCDNRKSNFEIGMAAKNILQNHASYQYYIGKSKSIPQLGEILVAYYTNTIPKEEEKDATQEENSKESLPKITTPDFKSADRYLQLLNYFN